MDKRERELRKLLKRHDCTLDGYTGSTHRRIVCNRTGRTFFTSLTPKNVGHWLRAVRRDIRRLRGGDSATA